MIDGVPEDGPEFDAMMRSIDAGFAERGVKITARPLQVSREISRRYGVDFPMFRPRANSPPNLRRFGPLYERIQEWFKATYGKRLIIDISVGKVVVDLDGDFYALRLARVWGTVEFLAGRRFFQPTLARDQLYRSNILQDIDDLTESKVARLSTAAIDAVFEVFPIGLLAFSTIDATVEDEPLLRTVQGDLETSADKLLGQGQHYGESKWASLQAAEKCLKAAINLTGSKYRRGHSLEKLIQQLDDMGIMLPSPGLASSIQCLGGIRYGEQSCGRQEAFIAHHSSIRLIHDVIIASAAFRMNMTIRKLGIGTYSVTNIPSGRLRPRDAI